jgi:hypothetical protein
MTLPQQEHNSLLATREFLIDLTNEEKILGVPEKVRLNAKYLLKFFPTREKLDELYEGQTFASFMNSTEESEEDRPNKIVNDNQTWKTPGLNWKTEVEFVPNQ